MRSHSFRPIRLRSIVASLALATFLAVNGAAPADAAASPTRAKSDCGSGYFCVWSSSNFSGTIQRFSATNSYRAITLSSTRSYYNNRSYRTWLHAEPSGGGSTVCVNPGSSNASTSGWQSYAEAVYLATVVNC